jgi:serine/threonine protein kinase
MIETKGYKLIQTNKTDSYILYIKGDHKFNIYLSLSETNILSNIFYDDDDDNDDDNDEYNKDNKDNKDNKEQIIFTAETVEPLTNFLKKNKTNLTMELATRMSNDLSKQLAYLELNNLAFYGYDLDDILVINESIFFIANTRYLLDIEESNIVFNSPIVPPYFSSPEVVKLTNLPSKVNYRSNYYSLGSLILFCLLNVHMASAIKKGIHIDILLKPLSHTKMYWFLKRCFLPDCEKRILLFI